MLKASPAIFQVGKQVSSAISTSRRKKTHQNVAFVVANYYAISQRRHCSFQLLLKWISIGAKFLPPAWSCCECYIYIKYVQCIVTLLFRRMNVYFFLLAYWFQSFGTSIIQLIVIVLLRAAVKGIGLHSSATLYTVVDHTIYCKWNQLWNLNQYDIIGPLCNTMNHIIYRIIHDPWSTIYHPSSWFAR